jgi:hypothetical protein
VRKVTVQLRNELTHQVDAVGWDIDPIHDYLHVRGEVPEPDPDYPSAAMTPPKGPTVALYAPGEWRAVYFSDMVSEKL